MDYGLFKISHHRLKDSPNMSPGLIFAMAPMKQIVTMHVHIAISLVSSLQEVEKMY